jgi:hypothetical protein
MRRGGQYSEAATFVHQSVHLALAKGRAEMLVRCVPL